MSYNLSEEERGRMFPVHVEMDEESPVLDLGERGSLVNVPERGCALVDFERNEDGTLSIKTVCFEGGGESDEKSDGDLERDLRSIAEEEIDEGEKEEDGE